MGCSTWSRPARPPVPHGWHAPDPAGRRALRPAGERPELLRAIFSGLGQALPCGRRWRGLPAQPPPDPVGLNQLYQYWDLALELATTQPLRRETRLRCALLSAGCAPSFSLRAGTADWSPSARWTCQLRVPNSPLFNWSCFVLLIQGPHGERRTPWAYGVAANLRGDFYLEQRAGFRRTPQSLRQWSTCWPPWAGTSHCRPAQTICSVGGAGGGSVWARASACCASLDGRAGGGDDDARGPSHP